jgi:hypothetical protein
MGKLVLVTALLLIIPTGSVRIAPLAAVTDTIGAAADAAGTLGKVAESLGRGGGGVRAYDVAARRRAADRLREIGREAAMLPRAPGVLIDRTEKAVRGAWRACERETLLIAQRLRADYADLIVALGETRVALQESMLRAAGRARQHTSIPYVADDIHQPGGVW